jgi:hypothetical protein
MGGPEAEPPLLASNAHWAPVEQSGVLISLSRRRPPVQIRSGAPPSPFFSSPPTVGVGTEEENGLYHVDMARRVSDRRFFRPSVQSGGMEAAV